MHLLKRIVFYVFIATAITAAVWAYFRLKESKEPVIFVQEHIPNSAVCVIESQSASDLVAQLTRQNLIWSSLLEQKTVQKTHHCINYLDSLFNSNEEVKVVIEGTHLFCSFFKDNNKVKNLVQFRMKEQNDASVFESFFEKVLKKSTSISSFDAFELNINGNIWLVCQKQGLIYLASDFSILENAISLEKDKSLAVETSYQQLVKLNGEQKNLVYFNHRYSNLFDKTIFNNQSQFSVDIQLNTITCNGYTKIDNLSFFNLLNHQKEGRITQYENLPDKAASIIGVSLNNPKLFYENLMKQASKEVAGVNSAIWKELSDSALYDVQSEFIDNIDGEIVSANYWLNDTGCAISSIKIFDEEKTKALLKLMSDTLHSINSFYVIKLQKQHQNLFSFFDVAAKNEYVGMMDNALFMFSNRKALDYYLSAITGSEFLSKNAEFMNYANENLKQDLNFMYYENCKNIEHSNLSRILNSSELNTDGDILSMLSLTAKNSQSFFQFRLNAMHAKEENSTQNNMNALWSFMADSTIQTPVYAFTNHSTQEHELCFQDNANQFYLVNSTGKILWKKQLSEGVQSKVYTVDIFKNGKLQLLFNTANYIHLLDRNGVYVQGYPVRIPAPITSPITLLDYDNTKDYRLFIACVDKKIYNYSLYGIKTEGYTPLKTDAVVDLPVSYVRIGPSDYLVTVDVNGKPYVFSRKGEGRIDFKNRLPKNVNQFYISGGSNLDNTKLICLDNSNAMLMKLSLSDKKELLKIGDDVQGFNAEFDLINDDAQQDMLVYGNGAVYAYDLFTNQILEYFNEQAVYDNAKVVNTSNHQWIIAFDKAGRKIDLINKEGKTVNSITKVSQMPLGVRLYKNDKTYLVIVSGKTVSCQELN